MRWPVAASLGCALLLGADPVATYPLDGYSETGIIRLEGYRQLQSSLLKKGTLYPGALWASDQIRLGLEGHPELELPEPDAELSRRLRGLLGSDAARYSVSVLDLSEPDQIRYFAHQDGLHQNPGSVGKLLVVLAWLQALADLHPDDPAARARLLRETRVTADGIIAGDSHEVPFWQPGDERIVKRPLRVGDQGSLWMYLDWMLSSSSNAAASVLLQQLVVLRHFGGVYPPSEAEGRAYVEHTPRSELRAVLLDALLTPLDRNGLDPSSFRQGGLFTAEGKRRIPGGDSTATTRALIEFLVRTEQGRLVDAWSSLELKRLLYLTDRRIRYASHPALSEAAVFFKSGSLYSCVEEPGFTCRKYHGNQRNFMNSVAIVETRSRDGAPGLHYLVAVLSNVLRENSAVSHQTLAMRIHRLVESLHPAPNAAGGPKSDSEPR